MNVLPLPLPLPPFRFLTYPGRANLHEDIIDPRRRVGIHPVPLILQDSSLNHVR